MATIDTYLERISNAIYGKDVRSAIVNAIRQCYDDMEHGSGGGSSSGGGEGGGSVDIPDQFYDMYMDFNNSWPYLIEGRGAAVSDPDDAKLNLDNLKNSIVAYDTFSPTNGSPVNNFKGVVLSYSNDKNDIQNAPQVQVATSTTGNWTRIKWNNVWSAWKKILDSGDLQDLSDSTNRGIDLIAETSDLKFRGIYDDINEINRTLSAMAGTDNLGFSMQDIAEELTELQNDLSESTGESAKLLWEAVRSSGESIKVSTNGWDDLNDIKSNTIVHYDGMSDNKPYNAPSDSFKGIVIDLTVDPIIPIFDYIGVSPQAQNKNKHRLQIANDGSSTYMRAKLNGEWLPWQSFLTTSKFRELLSELNVLSDDVSQLEADGLYIAFIAVTSSTRSLDSNSSGALVESWQDLNNIQPNTIVHYNGMADGKPLHAPFSSFVGIVVDMTVDPGTILNYEGYRKNRIQIACSGDNLYIRAKLSNVWLSWKKMADYDEFNYIVTGLRADITDLYNHIDASRVAASGIGITLQPSNGIDVAHQLTVALSENPGIKEVHFPSGTYYFTGNHPCLIRSDIKLIGDSSTVFKFTSDNLDNDDSGSGYPFFIRSVDGAKNITIENIRFENPTSNGNHHLIALEFGHAKNVRIKNCVFAGGQSTAPFNHYIQLCGCDTVTIEGCRFELFKNINNGSVIYNTNYRFSEYIHLAKAAIGQYDRYRITEGSLFSLYGEVNQNDFSYDNADNKTVMVKDCLFISGVRNTAATGVFYGSAIGSHGMAVSSVNMHVHNNTFEGDWNTGGHEDTRSTIVISPSADNARQIDISNNMFRAYLPPSVSGYGRPVAISLLSDNRDNSIHDNVGFNYETIVYEGSNAVQFGNYNYAASGNIESDMELDDSAVTTAKIDDGAVTTAKLDDEAVTTAKLDDHAVTDDKIASHTIDSSHIERFALRLHNLREPILEHLANTYYAHPDGDTGVPSNVEIISTNSDANKSITEYLTSDSLPGSGVWESYFVERVGGTIIADLRFTATNANLSPIGAIVPFAVKEYYAPVPIIESSGGSLRFAHAVTPAVVEAEDSNGHKAFGRGELMHIADSTDGQTSYDECDFEIFGSFGGLDNDALLTYNVHLRYMNVELSHYTDPATDYD